MTTGMPDGSGMAPGFEEERTARCGGWEALGMDAGAGVGYIGPR